MAPARPIRARISLGPRALPPALAATRRSAAAALDGRVARLLAALAALCVAVLALTRLHESRGGGEPGAPKEGSDAPWLRPGGKHGDAEALAWRPSAVETLQCPSYAGPAWRKGEVPTRATVVAAEAMTTTAAAKLPTLPAAESSRVPLSPLPLHAVRLAPGASPHAVGQSLNSVYLVLLDPDRLLYSFRAQAKLPQRGAQPYRGWEDVRAPPHRLPARPVVLTSRTCSPILLSLARSCVVTSWGTTCPPPPLRWRPRATRRCASA